MTGPSPEQLKVAAASPTNQLGMAVYERQRELNELRAAAGVHPDVPHADAVILVRAVRESTETKLAALGALVLQLELYALPPVTLPSEHEQGRIAAYADVVTRLRAALGLAPR